jgi:uncharacterized protein
MGSVVHFEINADDPERAIKFYQDVFGWDIQKYDDVQMEYWLVSTGPKGKNGMDGAIMKRSMPAGAGVINTIAVDDIEDTIQKVVSAGGKKNSDIDTIPGIGQFCYCLDSEGNYFGVLQTMEM